MDDFLYPLFYSAQMGLNGYSFYSNPKFDALIDQARATADETQRRNLYAEAEKLVLDDVDDNPDLLLPRLPRLELDAHR